MSIWRNPDDPNDTTWEVPKLPTIKIGASNGRINVNDEELTVYDDSTLKETVDSISQANDSMKQTVDSVSAANEMMQQTVDSFGAELSGKAKQSDLDITNQNVAANAASLADITTLPDAPNNANDTTSLQAKINALSDGDTLTLKSGTYLVSTLTITKNNIKIIGKNTIIKCLGNTSPFISITGKNIKISGISFDGNNKVTTGMEIGSTSENVTVESCEILNCYNDGTKNATVIGLQIKDNSNRVYIKNTKFKNMVSTANSISGDNIGASRAIIVNSATSTTLSKNVFIQKCIIDTVLPVEDGDGIQITQDVTATDYSKVVIEDCFFTNCAKRAIKTNVKGVKIRRNEIVNSFPSINADRSDSMYAAISVYNSDVDVEENYIHGNSFSHAIDININATSLIQNVNILNNKISVMENSTITTNTGVIHVFAQSRNLRISGNKISKGQYGIYFRGDFDTAIVSNNDISGVSLHGLFIDDFNVVKMDNITVHGNIINSSNNGMVIKYGTPTVTANVVKAGGGFGTFGYQNMSNITKTGNVGYGSFAGNANIVSSLPALRSTTFDYGQQGALVLVSNAGQADALYMCVKLADNTFAWKQITLT